MRETIAVVGDTHSDRRFVRNVLNELPEDVHTVVQLGDFGFTFDALMIANIADWLNSSDLNQFIWLDGNHDEHDFIDDMVSDVGRRDRLIDMGGMRYRKVDFPDNLFYAPRGAVATIGDSRCMFMGGAYSIDERYRTPHVSWWPQEMITESDIRAAEDQKVDVMFTHDSPPNPTIDMMLMMHGYKVDAKSQGNRDALGAIVRSALPDDLYHGHYHYRYEGLHETPEYWKVRIHGVGANVNERGNIDSTAHLGRNYLLVEL